MNTGLVEGALVRWIGGTSLGVVRKMTTRTVEVQWDDADVPPIFAGKNPPLVRAALPARVRRRSTAQRGILGDLVSEMPPKWLVTLPGANGFLEKVVPEEDLRPDETLGPADRMVNGQIGTPRQFNLQLVTRHYRL